MKKLYVFWMNLDYRVKFALMVGALLLLVLLPAMACTPDPSVPDFNPNPAGDLLGISDKLRDVTRNATGK